jgi:ABC-type antimicrobial peptide transport system permease subunit
MIVTGIGLLAGIMTAAGATRSMSHFLYGIDAADPVSYLIGCVSLMVVSVVACFIPAYRATRIDPLQALRYE